MTNLFSMKDKTFLIVFSVLIVSTIENIINDPFYCGIAASKTYGNYPHKYPCLITKELFDRCQEIRASKNKRVQKFATRDFIFKGILSCENCGCSITPEIKTKKNGLSYIYYSCTNAKRKCKSVSISLKKSS